MLEKFISGVKSYRYSQQPFQRIVPLRKQSVAKRRPFNYADTFTGRGGGQNKSNG